MAATPYMNSTQLINAVKRKIAFPISQNTFSNQDILDFLNEEMMISQVPSMLLYHEEYFVFIEEVDLLNNVIKYPIPNRAIGMRLRDLFYKDSQGNLYEMTRINPDEKAVFEQGNSPSNMLAAYYLQGNEVVLTPNNIFAPTGSLQFVYFLRPNQLVDVDRAATINLFRQTAYINDSIIEGDYLEVDNERFYAKSSGSPTDHEFIIGATTADTATNASNKLNTFFSGDPLSSSTDGNAIFIDSRLRNLETETSNGDGIGLSDDIGLILNSIPSNITALSKIDMLQTLPGHRTYDIDVFVPAGAISGNILTLYYENVPDAMLQGDYICSANECIIPQIPPDLHNGLAERACARILAALGDSAGLQTVNSKIQEIDSRQGNLLDQRVDGAPQKVVNRHGLLASSKRRYYRIF